MFSIYLAVVGCCSLFLKLIPVQTHPVYSYIDDPQLTLAGRKHCAVL